MRRDAILDVAEQLIRTKGYERMSIQDVQDALGVSRGAIYHYFDSKSALLEAVVERMVEAVMAVLAPIADDPDLPATPSCRAVFTAASRWKAERQELMVALAGGLVLRPQRHRARAPPTRGDSLRLAPLLATRRAPGHGGGQPSARARPSTPRASSWPSWWSRATRRASSSSIAWLAASAIDDVERAVAAYDEAVERILGLPAGSFRMIDEPSLRFWFA